MPDPSLHHVGYVVSSIDNQVAHWTSTLSAVSTLGPFTDPLQQVRVLFLEFTGGQTRLELVEPTSDASPAARFLAKGGGLHHLCFEVSDLASHIRYMKGQRAILVRHPVPAVAFDGRPIAWLMTREKLLVELLERPPAQLQ